MSQSKIEVKLNFAGVGALLKSEGMQSMLRGRAERIAGGDGEVEVYVAGTRAVAEAQSRSKNNDMLKRIKGA